MTEYDTDIDAPPIHIVCGLPFESRSIRRALPTKSFRLWFSGADAGRARELALAAAASAPAGLISFGLAGGVDPALAPGSLVIPTDVIDAKRQLHPVTGLWRTALLAAAKANRMEVESGLLAGVTRVAATPAEKARLWVERQAAAVDMESLAVAEAAKAFDLPFVILRAVGDPAGRAIPDVARGAVGSDGHIRLMPVLKSVARRPGLIGEFVQLGRDTRAALRTLGRAAHELLPALLSLLRPR